MEWRSLPPLAALKAFAALAERGSFTAAGAALNVSHAAVSQHVRKLEDHLGVPLVRRGTRDLVLTPDGSALALALGRAFGDMGAAIDRITGAADAAPVRITTTPNFGTHWLAPRLGDFRRRHPEIEVMVNASVHVARVGPDGYDIAIRSGTGDWPGCAAELLVPSDYVIVAAPSLAGAEAIAKPSDLLGLPWVHELGTDDVSTWLATHGVTEACLRHAITLPGGLVRDAIRRGDGVGAIARAFVEDDIEAGDLRVLYSDARMMRGYFLVTPPGALRAPVKAMAAWLRREARRPAPATIDSRQ